MISLKKGSRLRSKRFQSNILCIPSRRKLKISSTAGYHRGRKD
jgi:hypothetical protein